MTSPHKKLCLQNSTLDDDSAIGHEAIKYGNLSLNSLSSERDSPYKSPTILSFDAYGNLTSSDDPDAPYSHEVPSLAEFDYILNSFEGKLANSKSTEGKRPLHEKKKNGAYKKKLCKKIVRNAASGESVSLSDSDLKQAFKKDFDTTSLGITSRYGRTRKQKKSDEGFLFGTLNFNELRKITSSSPSKNKHFSASEEKSDSDFFMDEDHKKMSKNEDHKKMSKNEDHIKMPKNEDHKILKKDFEPLSNKLTDYSSEDDFVNQNKIGLSVKSRPRKTDKSKKKSKRSQKNDSTSSKCPVLKIIKRKNKPVRYKKTASKKSKSENDYDKNLTGEIKASKNLDIIEPHKDKTITNKLKQVSNLPQNNSVALKSIEDDLNIIKSSLTDDGIATKTEEKSLDDGSCEVEFMLDSKFTPIKNKLTASEKSVVNNSELEILKMETLNDEIKIEDSLKSKYGREIKKTVLLDMSAQNTIKRESLEKSAIIEEEFLDVASSTNDLEIEKEHPCLYFIGDMVWVNVRGNPLWPGMITYPRNETNFTRFKCGLTLNKLKGPRQYHVVFFYDNNQTMWVNSTSIFSFKGLEHLSLYFKKIKENEDKNFYERSLLKAFLKMSSLLTQKAATTKAFQWYQAVDEASQAFAMERYERIQHFKAPIETKKRKFPKSVIPRSSKSSSVVKCEASSEVASSILNMKCETLSNKSKSSDDFSGFDEDSSFELHKAKRTKLESKIRRGDFEVYLQKHLDSTMESSNLSKEKAKKLLQKKWNKLTPAQKLRYKSKLSYDQSSSLDTTDDSSSDISSVAPYKPKKNNEDEVQEPSRGTYKVPRHEKVCVSCESGSNKPLSDMVKCKGICGSHFHLSCVGLDTLPLNDFKCADCLSGVHKCFICKSVEGERFKCSVTYCGKFYHDHCLKSWPQVYRSAKSRQIEKLVCPRHVCHMCTANADDMNDAAARTPPYTRCIRCPTSYHTGETCIAAGVEELSQNYHICTKHIKHSKSSNHHFNVNWCFCCSKGGSLLLCDQCPAAFHAECLNITAPEGGYVCEDCVNGKFPVYGDIVWVKLGQYRWWPGEVLHPRYIPDNIENLHHVQGMFCVHFFGSDDYYWLSRGRTFHYQEGDEGSKSSASKVIEQKFQKALDEAVVAYRKQKEKREMQEQSRSLKGNMRPPPYVKVDTNRPVGNVRLVKLDPSTVTKCDCDPYSENPCGSDDKCINRMLMVECIKEVCAAKERCNNQRFQRRQYPNVFPFKTSGRGWGLKTKDLIKKGSFVIEYCGELIDEAEFRRRIDEMHDSKEQNYYFLTVETDRMIDAGPKGNLARFMNHSCQPNCETQKWTVGADTRVGLFALQDIAEGSELTFNYNLECVGTEKKICNCGAQNCSGFIGVKVQKFDVSGGGLKKVENGIKKKKRGRKRKNEKETENECFRCGYEGDLILCDVSTCPKGYHLDCLGLKELPKGKWICPWHHCDECGTRAASKCIMCPNSYCKVHTNDKFNPSPGLENVCMDHCTEDLEAGSDESGNEIPSSSSSSRGHSPEVPT